MAKINIAKYFSRVLFYFFTIVIVITILNYKAQFNMDLYANSQKAIEQYGVTDYASYVKAALLIKNNGIEEYKNSVYVAQSPGMALLELVILSISPNAALPLCLLFVTALLWAVFMARLQDALLVKLKVPENVSFFLPLIILLTPLFLFGYITGLLLISEPISTPIFAIAVIEAWLLFLNILDDCKVNIKKLVLVGFLFALASYIRAQFELIFILLIITSFFLTILCVFIVRDNNNLTLNAYLLGIIVIFLSYSIFTLPYKIYIKSASMVHNEFELAILWHDTSYWNSLRADFLIQGGEQVVCELDQQFCNDVQGRIAKGKNIQTREYIFFTFKTILLHPITFVAKKTHYLAKAWKKDHWDAPPSEYIAIFSKLLLLLIPSTIACIYFANKKSWLINSSLYVIYLVSIFLGASAFSIITHFEPRYLLPVKLFIFVSFLLSVANLLSKLQNKLKVSYD